MTVTWQRPSQVPGEDGRTDKPHICATRKRRGGRTGHVSATCCPGRENPRIFCSGEPKKSPGQHTISKLLRNYRAPTFRGSSKCLMPCVRFPHLSLSSPCTFTESPPRLSKRAEDEQGNTEIWEEGKPGEKLKVRGRAQDRETPCLLTWSQ